MSVFAGGWFLCAVSTGNSRDGGFGAPAIWCGWMAETYLLFDGFDVAVRDWRCRSSSPKAPFSKFAVPHSEVLA